MRLTLVALLALMPLPAMADCGLTVADTRAMAAGLVGEWTSKPLQIIMVTKGVPSVLPTEGASPPAVFSLGGDDLVMENVMGDLPMTLTPVLGGTQDYALPGESPLLAGELLAGAIPPNMGCAAEQLPQFHGQSNSPTAGEIGMQIFVVDQNHLINIMSINGPGAATEATQFRAIIEFRR